MDAPEAAAAAGYAALRNVYKNKTFSLLRCLEHRLLEARPASYRSPTSDHAPELWGSRAVAARSELLARGLGVRLWQDLYHPDAKTVRRTLSAVINFAKFREEKVQSYEDLREESEATLERQAALEQQHVQLVRENGARVRRGGRRRVLPSLRCG